MPINQTPAGLQQPQTTASNATQTGTQGGQAGGTGAQVSGLRSPDTSLLGAQTEGGGEQSGDGGDSGALGASASQQAGGQGSNLPLGSENFSPPGGSGTGANIGAGGGSGATLTVNQKAQSLVDDVHKAAKGGDIAGVVHGVTTMLNLSGTDDFSGMSVQMIIQKVLMEAYEGSQKDLRSIANRYQFFNNVKNNIRNESTRARAALASAGSTGSMAPFSAKQTTNTLSPDGINGKVSFSQASDWNPFTPIDGSSLDPNTGKDGVSGAMILNKNTLSTYADKLDQDLDTAGDNSSQMQTRLQAVTNEQQQLLSTITQLLKNWNDTSMSIIHNV